MLKTFLSLSFLLLLIAPAVSLADLPDSRKQLKVIRQRIENIQIDLAEKKQTESALSRELTILKRTLKNIDQRISRLRKDQRQVAGQIKQQQTEINAGKRSVKQVGKRLQKRLIALYKEGDAGLLRVLFSTDSPTELVQQYQYLTRVLEADNELINQYRQVLEQQQERLGELQQLEKQKQKLLDREQLERSAAEQGRRLQAKVLNHVRSDRGRIKQELAGLKEKSSRLQTLIKKIKQKPKPSSRTVSGQPAATEFQAGKGNLNWPVVGDVLIGFGKQKDSQLGTIYESNGIEIAAKDGQPMRAVANGSVVFADWFKGYGNLLILSHAGGYHTLYAQAARLERKIGEAVQAGELVGYTGLAGRDSIYFEIRYNGAPVNPLKWLKRR